MTTIPTHLPFDFRQDDPNLAAMRMIASDWVVDNIPDPRKRRHLQVLLRITHIPFLMSGMDLVERDGWWSNARFVLPDKHPLTRTVKRVRGLKGNRTLLVEIGNDPVYVENGNRINLTGWRRSALLDTVKLMSGGYRDMSLDDLEDLYPKELEYYGSSQIQAYPRWRPMPGYVLMSYSQYPHQGALRDYRSSLAFHPDTCGQLGLKWIPAVQEPLEE
jgi:hypothetical protein